MSTIYGEGFVADRFDPTTWRKEALNWALVLLDEAGPEYAMHAADHAERNSDGVLKGLGAKVRKVIAERRAAQ